MLELGKKYRQVGGKCIVAGTDWSKETIKHQTVSPNFPFGCKEGIFTGLTKLGWQCFDLLEGKKALMNGGNYELIKGEPK